MQKEDLSLCKSYVLLKTMMKKIQNKGNDFLVEFYNVEVADYEESKGFSVVV